MARKPFSKPAALVRSSANTAQELVPAAGWINVGIETDNGFISLQGAGIPIERLKETSATANSSEEWQQMAAINNHVIGLIQAKLAELAAGEAVVLNLSVELRKPADKAEVTSKYDLSSITI